ncbi:MAG: S-layer homology domain-containing protein [Solibacillus sp.]
MNRLIVAIIAIFTLQFTMPVASPQATTDITVHYTALGDSLAAGINEQGELGPSYTDYLAQQIEASGLSVSFNKGFTYPGYTTVDVLADLQENVVKSVYNTAGEQDTLLSIADGIAGADVLTISAGANDVLKHVQKDEAGQLAVDAMSVLQEVGTIAANYDAIFAEIEKYNKQADVIVMGYYNPFPHLEGDVQQQLDLLISTMDRTVKQVVEEHGGVFVEVNTIIAQNPQAYLPNPQNIHLSAAGYKVVSEEIYKSHVANRHVEDLEQELKYFKDTEAHWAKEYIQFVAGAGIMNGYADDTFKPNQHMTRVQLVSVLSRTFDWHALGDVPFVDVASYAEVTQSEVTAAYEAGIVKGYEGYLKPKEPITRAQLASMLLRAYEHEVEEVYVPSITAPFTDIAGYNADTQRAITFLYEYELAQGVSATQFSPASPLTRAQAAKILTNVYAE